MPLSSRREEIDRFLGGTSDVTVATDVLGHGVNLPCETLLFAETTKFDGESRRDLLPWELAQIAGRAGRFGLVERGHVGVLTGVPWANADPEIVEEALQPHVVLPSGHLGYRIVDEARIRPRLSDLGVDDPAPPRRGARGLASRRDARVGLRELARRRVAEPDPRPARRDPAQAARAQPEAHARRHLEADQRAGRRGQRGAARDPRARRQRRHGPAVAAHVPARSCPAARRDAGGSRASWKNRKHPALVRAAVSRRRRRHDRAGGRARGNGRSARRRAPAARGERPHDRPLPHLRQDLRAVVPALRPLLRAPLSIFGDTAASACAEDQPRPARDAPTTRTTPRATGPVTTGSGPQIGASALGATVYELQEGQSICPYHYEYGCEEWAIVLSGRPTFATRRGRTCSSLATSSASRKARAARTSSRTTRAETARVMLLSDKPSLAAAVYPDSGKIGIFPPDERDKIMVRRESASRLLRPRALDRRPAAGSAAPRRSSSSRRGTRSCSG